MIIKIMWIEVEDTDNDAQKKVRMYVKVDEKDWPTDVEGLLVSGIMINEYAEGMQKFFGENPISAILECRFDKMFITYGTNAITQEDIDNLWRLKL